MFELDFSPLNNFKFFQYMQFYFKYLFQAYKKSRSQLGGGIGLFTFLNVWALFATVTACARRGYLVLAKRLVSYSHLFFGFSGLWLCPPSNHQGLRGRPAAGSVDILFWWIEDELRGMSFVLHSFLNFYGTGCRLIIKLFSYHYQWVLLGLGARGRYWEIVYTKQFTQVGLLFFVAIFYYDFHLTLRTNNILVRRANKIKMFHK